MTLIEVALAAVVLAFSLMTMAKGFGTNFTTVQRAKDLNAASRFLEETMDSLESQPYENLPLLNGNVFFDEGAASSSRYRIDLTVSPAAVDLLQIRAVIMDRRTSRVLTRLVTYRSRR
jgi:Tfp pilus assembly protein PilV